MARRTPRAGPATGTILKRRRRRTSRGQTVKNSFSATFEVFKDLIYDFDATKLVDHVTIRLAEHYRDSILSGKHPSGGTLKPLKRKSLDGTYERGPGRNFFNNTGDSAQSWLLGPIRGTSVKASRHIKPTITGGAPGEFDWLINAWLARGIDLQSIRGEAEQVIKDAVDEFMAGAIGEKIKTPARIDRSGGSLKTKKTKLS